MPDVELVTRPPALDIRSSFEPCRDLLHSDSRIVPAAPKLHHHVQLVFLPASAAIAPVCFDGFLDEGVKEFVESVLPISGDNELSSPLGELTTMFLLSESLLHFSNRTGRLRGVHFLASPLQPAIKHLTRYRKLGTATISFHVLSVISAV